MRRHPEVGRGLSQVDGKRANHQSGSASPERIVGYTEVGRGIRRYRNLGSQQPRATSTREVTLDPANFQVAREPPRVSGRQVDCLLKTDFTLLVCATRAGGSRGFR